MCTLFGFDPVSVWSLTTGGSCCGQIRGVKRSSVPRSALNLCLLYYHLRSCQMCKCDLSPRKSLLMNPPPHHPSLPPAPARNPATGCFKRNSCKLNVFLTQGAEEFAGILPASSSESTSSHKYHEKN